jgi:hypothetical protein
MSSLLAFRKVTIKAIYKELANPPSTQTPQTTEELLASPADHAATARGKSPDVRLPCRVCSNLAAVRGDCRLLISVSVMALTVYYGVLPRAERTTLPVRSEMLRSRFRCAARKVHQHAQERARR